MLNVCGEGKVKLEGVLNLCISVFCHQITSIYPRETESVRCDITAY